MNLRVEQDDDEESFFDTIELSRTDAELVGNVASACIAFAPLVAILTWVATESIPVAILSVFALPLLIGTIGGWLWLTFATQEIVEEKLRK